MLLRCILYNLTQLLSNILVYKIYDKELNKITLDQEILENMSLST